MSKMGFKPTTTKHKLHFIFCGFVLSLLVFIKGESTTCLNGFYYNSTQGNCNACSKCQHGHRVMSKCTNQSDTVCKACPRGTFSTDGLKCTQCSHCLAGTFVDKYCTSVSDTKCKQCPDGTYSTDLSMRRCRPCSGCSRLHTVVRNCSKTKDYKCGDCIQGYFKHPNLPMCIKCAYCHPDSAIPVPECATKSKNPHLQCMPVYGADGAPVGFKGYSRSNVLSTLSTTARNAMPLLKTSTSYNSILIPPYISIPIIAVSVSLIIAFLICLVAYKVRKRVQMSKSRTEMNTLSTWFRKSKCIDYKRESHSCNDIVMVHCTVTSSDLSTTETTADCHQTSLEQCQYRENFTNCCIDNSKSSENCILNHQSTTNNSDSTESLKSFEIVDLQEEDVSPTEQNANTICVDMTKRSACAENEAFENDEDSSASALIVRSDRGKQSKTSSGTYEDSDSNISRPDLSLLEDHLTYA